MALPLIIASGQRTKHIKFRAAYTPSMSFNPAKEQLVGEASKVLYGLQVTGPAGGPFNVHPGAFISGRTIVKITATQTIDSPGALVAPFVMYAFTSDEKDATDVIINYAEDQLIPVNAVILGEFDGLGLRSAPRPCSIREIDQSSKGGIIERVTVETTGGETFFDNLDIPFTLSRGSNLWVFRNGLKIAFEQAGVSTIAGWNFTTKNQINIVGSSIVVAADENWEFILDDQIEFQQQYIGTGATLIYSLTFGTYIPGARNLLVFKEGVLQRPGVDYTEDNTTNITFSIAPAVDEVVELVKHNGIIFAEENDALALQTNFELNDNRIRASRFGVFIFRNGLKLLPDEDYTELGSEEIQLIVASVLNDRVDIYNLRQSMPVFRQRRLSEFKNMTFDLEGAILDPDSTRIIPADRTNPFKSGDDITNEIGAAISGIDLNTTRARWQPGRVKANAPGVNNKVDVIIDPSFRFGNQKFVIPASTIDLIGLQHPTLSQWVLIHFDSGGALAQISGGPAASPTIPSMMDKAPLALVNLGPIGTNLVETNIFDMRHPAQPFTKNLLEAIIDTSNLRAAAATTSNPLATLTDLTSISFGGIKLGGSSVDTSALIVPGSIPAGFGSGPVLVNGGLFISKAVILYGASFNIDAVNNGTDIITIPLIEGAAGSPVPVASYELIGAIGDSEQVFGVNSGSWRGSDTKMFIKTAGLASGWEANFGTATSSGTTDVITFRWMIIFGV